MKQATKLNQIILLIQSLSKAEKRYIRLCSNLQNGDKNYMILYDLICEGFSPDQIFEKFCCLCMIQYQIRRKSVRQKSKMNLQQIIRM